MVALRATANAGFASIGQNSTGASISASTKSHHHNRSDRSIHKQMDWIASFTKETKLQTALVFASCEEYCLRPVRKQPLIVYRFINHQRHIQRGGLTKLPASKLIWLVSEEIPTQDSLEINLLDNLAIAQYQQTQALAEQQMQRIAVKQEFSHYLAKKLGPLAVQWLQLYLEGQSQEAIAHSLNLLVKQVYRLREKVTYHAHVFALKVQPELVSNWL